jgi:uncharacterized protein
MAIFKRRIAEQILKRIESRGLIVILGPRQAGKTTLVKTLLKDLGHSDAYFNCEQSDVRRTFKLGDTEPLRNLIGKRTLVAFDEAQTIPNIGKILKLFHDTYPEIKIIATGSSSFELANEIREPLTGRADEFMLYPLSLAEISETLTITPELFKDLLRFGTYPAIVAASTSEDKEAEIKRIATNYLYKDVFTFEALRNPKNFEDLVTLLATRVGGIVNTSSLAKEIGVAPATVENYIRLLEQAFVIKRVYSFARNYAKELKKAYKIYFIDNGVMNALTSIPKSDNTDALGKNFESLIYTEFIKGDTLHPLPPRTYFWRTSTKLEIDFVRTYGNTIDAYEVKYGRPDATFTTFRKLYPEAVTHIITPANTLPHCTIPQTLRN